MTNQRDLEQRETVMTGSYVFWAVLGMIAYSVTTIVVKIASHEGLPSSVVVAIATTVVSLACWSMVVARAQLGLLLHSLSTPSGAWSLAAGTALSVAVMSLFRQRRRPNLRHVHRWRFRAWCGSFGRSDHSAKDDWVDSCDRQHLSYLSMSNRCRKSD